MLLAYKAGVFSFAALQIHKISTACAIVVNLLAYLPQINVVGSFLIQQSFVTTATLPMGSSRPHNFSFFRAQVIPFMGRKWLQMTGA